ncbi:unnamed protein product [Pleuronectes platessa]|uniref:Uncharacterized protein n=1 Tax=Pleuronectes platessa TaxID=8262 RepID=A0A9N7YG28_PLEPL|nr:unnamed protein product [Pleuronectes platessa]
MSVRAVFVISALMLPLLLLSGTSATDQPTCKMIWFLDLFDSSALINQVKIWSKNLCSGPQEKCMYELLTYSSKKLEVKHTSLITNETSTINFIFAPTAAPITPATPSFCSLVVISTSNTTIPTSNHYCLIYNLMDGSGLTQVVGAREICNAVICPSLATATCKIA